MGKLTNRIPGLHLLISVLSYSALRIHVESLDKALGFKGNELEEGWVK